MSVQTEACDAARMDALYQVVFDAMAEGVVVLSAAAEVVMANTAAAQIFGLEFERLRGASPLRPLMRAIREDGSDLPAAEQPGVVSLRTGATIKGFVVGVCRGDGTIIWLSVNSRPLASPQGDGVVLVTFSDITALKRIEVRLRESEARFRNILHHTPIATAIVELSGRFGEVNRAFCDLVGYSAEELRSRMFQSITAPEDLAQSHDEVRRMLDGSISLYQSEHRYTRRDGVGVWVLLSVSLQRDEWGAPQHFIVQLQDIGERRAAQEHLDRLTQRLSLALGCADIGVWEWSMQSDLVYADEKVIAMYGLEGRSLAPMPLAEWRQFLLPEDLRRTTVAFERLVTRRRRDVIEYRIRRADGALRHMQVVADVVLDGADVKSVIGVNLDITERKLAEQALQTARRQLRTLIDTLPAWVAMIDRDGCFLVANNSFCEAVRLPMGAVEGRSYHEVLPQEYRQRHLALIERCLAGEVVEFMEQGADVGGAVVYGHGRYVPLREGGRVVGLVLALTDVSELKRTQLQLTRLNRDLVHKVDEVHQLQSRLHEMAVRDALTGLHNRRFLDEQLPYELARARRLRLPLCVALGDIDHFKKLNDTYGHQAGDAVLRTLRELFTQLVRESDLVCRWGGEEILIVMPDVSGEVALQRIERLRQALAAQTIRFGQHELHVTISFGIAAQQEGATADDIIGAADRALYEAKAAGRNTSRLFSGRIPQPEDAAP